MNPKRSQVFENFAKIAIDSGLITVNADAMTEDEKYKNKEWKDTVQALYGVHPDGEEKEDILDKAHPKPVIIAPSYDKLNGLVENLKERHNIMVGIALKPNNGNITQHRYAEAKGDLLKELIKSGFMLDNKNIEDLRKLADSCSDRLVKKAVPLLIPLAVGGIALIAAFTAIVNNTTPSDQGVITNTERAIKWIDEAKEDLPQVSGDLSKLNLDLLTLYNLSKEYMSLGTIDISTPDKFVSAASNEKEKFAVVQKYKQACKIMAQRLPKYINILHTSMPQTQSYGDFADKLVDMYRYFDPDDADEAAGALETLQKSLLQSVNEANYFIQTAKQQEPDLISILEKHTAEQKSAPNQMASVAPSEKELAETVNKPTEL